MPWADYLLAMGVQPWVPREAVIGVEADGPVTAIDPAPDLPAPVADDLSAVGWDELAALVARCARCGLSQGRTQTVFGVGNRTARWMVIGEAPGAEEDKRGEPFVGRAGQLLDAMLAAIGLDREQVFIANILKCRPPGNRDPRPEEAESCAPYLRRQIELVAPSIILAVGRIAAQNLLRVDTPIGRMRGQLFEYGVSRIPVIVTYHPAYLLRSPREKRKVWQDLLRARQVAQAATT